MFKDGSCTHNSAWLHTQALMQAVAKCHTFPASVKCREAKMPKLSSLCSTTVVAMQPEPICWSSNYVDPARRQPSSDDTRMPQVDEKARWPGASACMLMIGTKVATVVHSCQPLPFSHACTTLCPVHADGARGKRDECGKLLRQLHNMVWTGWRVAVQRVN